MSKQAKGRGADPSKIQLSEADSEEKAKRLGGIVAEFRGAKYLMKTPSGNRTFLDSFSYDFRQNDRYVIHSDYKYAASGTLLDWAGSTEGPHFFFCKCC